MRDLQQEIANEHQAYCKYRYTPAVFDKTDQRHGVGPHRNTRSRLPLAHYGEAEDRRDYPQSRRMRNRWGRAMNQHARAFSRLVGLVVELVDRCKRCESIGAVIGDKSHAHALHCQMCGADRGRLSRSTSAFLIEIIDRFGRPTTPIKIRRSGRTRDHSETNPECAPTASSADQQGKQFHA
jgi:hypothetical protein